MATSGLTTIGDLSVEQSTPDEFVVKWKIHNFASLSAEADESYISPQFSFAGESWSLQIFPNGQSEIMFENPSEKSVGFIDLILFRRSSGSAVSIDYSVGLETLSGRINLEKCFSDSFEKEDGYGATKLLRRADILRRRKRDFTPLGILTVVCHLKCSTETVDKNKRNKKLLNDLKSLMLSGNYSDITITVRGEEFHLHRNILASRSGFFYSKLTTYPTLNNTILVEDCAAHVFHSFVHFIYTGEADRLTFENVYDLYELSVKYREEQLKKSCLQFMCNNISVDSFCNIFLLAMKYSEKKQFEVAVKFFAGNAKEIIKSVKWQSLLIEYPLQANDLLINGLEISHHRKISK